MTDLIEAKTCTCPSGDGSLRWPCPVHGLNGWQHAPEGATHYFVGSQNPWRDLSGKDWLWWQDDRWHSPHEEQYADLSLCRDLDLSSAGLIERNADYLIARP